MPVETIFFDLDGTLYPERNGLWKAIKERIDLFLLERMDFPAAETPIIRQRFLETYGTTLRGLQEEYQIDSQDYLDFVHDLPLQNYLTPNPDVNRLMDRLQIPCWILTNSDIKHARRVLSILGLEGVFAGIIDIHELQFVCKPDPQAYHKALEIAGARQAGTSLFIDDSPANVLAADRLGFQTLLVSENPPANFTGASIPVIQHLSCVYPDLVTQDGRERIENG